MAVGRPSAGMLGTEGLKALLFVVYPLLAVIVVPVALVGASRGLRDELFHDPGHELGVLWGAFSYFGILMWSAATTCCVVAWTFLTRTSRSHRLRSWFLASAFLSAALMVDDTFLIHELVLPEFVGIPERVVLLGYAGWIGWYLIHFRRQLFTRPDSAVFAASLFLLGSSVAIDGMISVIGSFPFSATIENGPKLLGITAWLYFFFRATLGVITQTDAPPDVAGQDGSRSAAARRRLDSAAT